MKFIKLFLCQVLFFGLILLIRSTLTEYRILKIVILSGLILLFSIYLYRFFKDQKSSIKAYVFNLFSMVFLFEISKGLGYFFGTLPFYYDIPLYIGVILSFLAIALYSGAIYVLERFVTSWYSRNHQ